MSDQQSPDALARFEGELAQHAYAFADGLFESDRDQVFNREGWGLCARLGIQAMNLPEAHGGSAVGYTEAAHRLERLGYHCRDNGLLLSLGAHMWGFQSAVVRFGTEQQLDSMVPKLVRGAMIGGLAVTEPAGPEPSAISTFAQETQTGFLLNGTKRYVTNGNTADVLLVIAKTGRDDSFLGLSAFLVDARTPGVSAIRESTMGVRTSGVSTIRLEDVFVPFNYVLGGRNQGWRIFNHAMNTERAMILAPTVGTICRLLESCTAFVRTRSTESRRLGSFQSVTNRLADMAVDLRACSALVRALANDLDHDRLSRSGSCEAKLFLSDAWVRSSMNALAIHGGLGYLTQSDIEREVRDSFASQIYSGTSDMQRNLIASWLL